jgi:hypothetical protein
MDGWSRASERGRRGRTYVRTCVQWYRQLAAFRLLAYCVTDGAREGAAHRHVGWLVGHQPTNANRPHPNRIRAGRPVVSEQILSLIWAEQIR